MNDGGPAYPCLDSDLTGLHLRHAGMMLRDRFALSALQGMLAESCHVGQFSNTYYINGQVHMSGSDGPITGEQYADYFAKASYVMADAMLKARGVE
jgi:hypothetical protein